MVGFIPRVGGFALAFFHLVEDQLLFARHFAVFAGASILISVLALVRDTSIGSGVGVSVTACEF